MIIVDANLLIYAVDSDSPQHPSALTWLEHVLSNAVQVALPWAVIVTFVRVTTRPGIMRQPQTHSQALGLIDEWLAQPYVTTLAPGDDHWPIFRNLLRTVGTAGNLVPDAHLAALAIEHGCSIYSADNDFRRFPGVEYVNPLA